MKKNNKYYFLFIVLFIGCILFFILDILLGSVKIPLHECIAVLTGKRDENDVYSLIIFQSRLPKAITAILAGAALPATGLMMQTYFKNPLAGPDILGISWGASLLVAIVIMGTGLHAASFDTASIILAGVAGSTLMLLLIMLAALRIRDNVSLLIFGLMMGTAISAVVSVFQYFSEKQALKNYILWTFGNLSGVTWTQLHFMIPFILPALIACFFTSKWLNGLLLGESYARSIGMPIGKVKFIIILITGILIGAVTAFCGPIAFIGLAIPHIARLLLRTTNHFILMPASVMIGIIVMLLCDMIAQLPGQEMILPLNSITAFMGAPFVIWLVIRNRQLKRYF